jgi:hypothetical protein
LQPCVNKVWNDEASNNHEETKDIYHNFLITF